MLRHHAYRTVGEFLNGGAVGPDSSSVKLLMAEAEQRLAATALEVLGPTLQHAEPDDAAEDEFWYETYLYSRAATVYGGTQQIQRNIIADRVLGLPTGVSRMDLELSDEQTLAERIGRDAARPRVEPAPERRAGTSAARDRCGGAVDFGALASAATTGSARSSCA